MIEAPTRARRLLPFVVAVMLLSTFSSLVPFVWPKTDDPRTADAVVILSGDHGERLPEALKLMQAGVAPTLVFVGTLDRAVENDLCQGGRVPYEVLCVRPDPDSTRQEAQATGELARSRGWRTIVVVTSDHHVTRSALLFRRCVDVTVQMVGGRAAFTPVQMARQIAHEWLGTLHAFTLARGC